MNSSCASNHGNLAGIPVSIYNATTLKEEEENRNLGKWLSCSRRISGNFG
jgi:hypothetical protein